MDATATSPLANLGSNIGKTATSLFDYLTGTTPPNPPPTVADSTTAAENLASNGANTPIKEPSLLEQWLLPGLALIAALWAGFYFLKRK